MTDDFFHITILTHISGKQNRKSFATQTTEATLVPHAAGNPQCKNVGLWRRIFAGPTVANDTLAHLKGATTLILVKPSCLNMVPRNI